MKRYCGLARPGFSTSRDPRIREILSICPEVSAPRASYSIATREHKERKKGAVAVEDELYS